MIPLIALVLLASARRAIATGGGGGGSDSSTRTCDPFDTTAPPYCSFPVDDCPVGSFLWSQPINPDDGSVSVRLINSNGNRLYTLPTASFPVEFGGPVKINITRAVSFDGYFQRAGATQPNERWRVNFYHDSVLQWSSAYTEDLQDRVRQASWRGPLGMMMFQDGVDQIEIEHWSVASMPAESPDSVVPVSLCMSFATLAVDECMADDECDDGNACTIDTCVGQLCVHSNVTVQDQQRCLPDDNANCVAECNGEGQCECLECVADGDCFDENVCTVDVCVDGMCMHSNVSAQDPGTSCLSGSGADACAGECDGEGNCECPECYDDADCDDGNYCTIGTCGVDGTCSYANVTAGQGEASACIGENPMCFGQCDGAGQCECYECVSDVGCDDENPCTAESCVDNQCVYSNVTAESGEYCVGDNNGPCLGQCDGTGQCACAMGSCLSNLDCDDNSTCTFDFCNTEGQCEFLMFDEGEFCEGLDNCDGSCDAFGNCQCDAECTIDAECDDGNLCTQDTCGQDGVCAYANVTAEAEMACLGDADGDACFGQCDGAGQCECDVGDCEIDGDCDDENACTGDVCVDGSCRNVLFPENTPCTGAGACPGTCSTDGVCECLPECESNADCASMSGVSNECAFSCVEGQCVFDTPRDSNCDDGNECTIDTCAGEECVYSDVSVVANVTCVNEEEDNCPGICNGDGACDCALRCDVDADCDDGDACTVDTCTENGFCRNTPGNVGGACTGLDDCDGTCVEGGVCVCDPECQDVDDCVPDGEAGCDYVCIGGECERIPNNALCNDGNECTVDLCTSQGTCSYTPQPENTICVDETEGSCTGTCQGTECVCPDECQDDSDCAPLEPEEGDCSYACVAGVCVNGTSNAALCDDGDECTQDTCVNGQCSAVDVANNIQLACVDEDNGDCAGVCQDGECVCECEEAADCVPDGEDSCNHVCVSGQCLDVPNNALCDDGQFCTADRCNANGECEFTPLPSTTACVDADNDNCEGTCQDGECECPPQCTQDIDCMPVDGPQGACNYDCVNGVCLELDNNAICNDDNVCTQDLCVNGMCENDVVSAPTPCSGPDNCAGQCTDEGDCFCPVTTCPPSGSLCYTLVPNEAMDDCVRVDTICDDQNSCTEDSCDDELGCMFTPSDDIDDGNPCTLDLCIPNQGVRHVNRTCPSADKCVMAMCNTETGDCETTPIDCDDNNPCTVDTCDPLSGCRSTSISDCVQCSQDEDCDDNDVCTSEFCDETTDTCTYTFELGSECEDENEQNEDLCVRNVCHPTHGCVPVQKQCPATLSALFYAHSGSGNVAELMDVTQPPPCTVGVCDPETGDCSLEQIDCSAGGDACTISFCDPTINQCVRIPRQCPVSNECNEAYCSSENGCQERPRLIEDPNACLRASCEPGDGIVFEDRDCDDGLSCTIDTCDPLTGCRHTPINCTDTDPCTTNERCEQGQCVSDPFECPQPQNLCLQAQCVPGQGCQVSDIECPPPENLMFDAVCNPATGDCFNVLRDCDDQDPCTEDILRLDGTCAHRDIPGCCRSNADCPLSTRCAVFSCDLDTNVCVESSNQNCCANDDDCDDGINCTIDTCEEATGTCFYQPVICDDPLNDLCAVNECSESSGQCVQQQRSCDDADMCTMDRCVPTTGECLHVQSLFCDDGNECTADVCDADTGTCLYGFQRRCNDRNPCTVDTCNPLTGDCMYTPIDVDDQNACTRDFCRVVEDQAEVVNEPISCDDGNPCTDDICNPVTGCEHIERDCSALANGNICLDASCNRQTGLCEIEQVPNCCRSNIECTARGERCTEEYCDYNTNRCVFTPRPNCCDADKDCDDRNKCTIDTCDAETGTCCHEPVVCEAPDACSVARCVPDRGCVIEPRDCSDENECTVDACELINEGSTAQCTHTPLECEQTEDPCDARQVCQAGACVAEAADGPCDDGDPCTIDHCSEREFKFQTPGLVQCTYEPVDCRDTNPCTRDFCDSTTGKCVHVRNPFQECCLTDDDCDDLNRCTREHCDTLTNKCVSEPVPNCCLSDYDCQDENACTHSERCDTVHNVCIVEQKSCCDFNDCTEDTCDPSTGECTHRSIADECNDFDICTIDFCDKDGGCRYEPRQCGQPDNQCLVSTCSSVNGCVDVARDCDDQNPCTVDSCDPEQGCVHTERDCDDGLACTVDSCSASTGRCQHRPVVCDDGDDLCVVRECDEAQDGACIARQVICNDGNACTTDECVSDVGCVHREISCDDGNPCTWDTCEAGKFGGCRHTHKRHCCQLDDDCDDNDECTEDTCQSGLCHFARLHTPECCEPGEAPAPPPNAALFAHAAPVQRAREVNRRANHVAGDGCGNGVVEAGEECDGDANDGFFTRCNEHCEFQTYVFAIVIVALASLCVLLGCVVCVWAVFAGRGSGKRARRSRRAMRD